MGTFCCVSCRLLSIAEETLTEFLSKATGTAVEWVQMPGMKVTIQHISCPLVTVDIFALIDIMVLNRGENTSLSLSPLMQRHASLECMHAGTHIRNTQHALFSLNYRHEHKIYTHRHTCVDYRQVHLSMT